MFSVSRLLSMPQGTASLFDVTVCVRDSTSKLLEFRAGYSNIFVHPSEYACFASVFRVMDPNGPSF